MKDSRFSRTFLSTSSAKPGSKIGISPRFSAATLSASLSTQTTVWPKSAKQAARHEANISGTDHRHAHALFLLRLLLLFDRRLSLCTGCFAVIHGGSCLPGIPYAESRK